MTAKQQASQKTKSRIPEFKNYREKTKWFDTHDMGDYQDEFKPIRVHFSKNLSQGLTIQFDPQTLDELREQAYKKGVGPTTLARMWILEHLNHLRGSGQAGSL